MPSRCCLDFSSLHCVALLDTILQPQESYTGLYLLLLYINKRSIVCQCEIYLAAPMLQNLGSSTRFSLWGRILPKEVGHWKCAIRLLVHLTFRSLWLPDYMYKLNIAPWNCSHHSSNYEGKHLEYSAKINSFSSNILSCALCPKTEKKVNTS